MTCRRTVRCTGHPNGVESCGDTAYEVGRYVAPGEGGKALDTGDYVVIWKRENGQWKLHRDICTTNTPAPGQ